MNDEAVLFAHLVSQHAGIFSPDSALVEAHEHEHDGTGTIRNHPRSDRTYDYAKMARVLSEADEPDPVQPDTRPLADENEAALTAALTERDYLEERLDELAYAVAPVEVIGEHSSANDPWANALDILHERAATREAVEQAVRAPLEARIAPLIEAAFTWDTRRTTTAQANVESWSPQDVAWAVTREQEAANALSAALTTYIEGGAALRESVSPSPTGDAK